MESFLTTNIDPKEPSWEVNQMIKFLHMPRVAVLEQEEETGDPASPRTYSTDGEW